MHRMRSTGADVLARSELPSGKVVVTSKSSESLIETKIQKQDVTGWTSAPCARVQMCTNRNLGEKNKVQLFWHVLVIRWNWMGARMGLEGLTGRTRERAANSCSR